MSILYDHSNIPSTRDGPLTRRDRPRRFTNIIASITGAFLISALLAAGSITSQLQMRKHDVKPIALNVPTLFQHKGDSGSIFTIDDSVLSDRTRPDKIIRLHQNSLVAHACLLQLSARLLQAHFSLGLSLSLS
jgi:hypothetical protein